MAKFILKDGKVILVDAEDLPKLVGYNWRTDRRGSVFARSSSMELMSNSVVMSRIILGIKHGDRSQVVNFKNDNKFDLRKNNLRIVNLSALARLPMIDCACGCGGKQKPYSVHGRPNQFLQGHYWKLKRRIDRANAKRKWGRARTIKSRHRYQNYKQMAMTFFGNVCCVCGLSYDGTNAPCFEFDHIDPSTKTKGVTELMGTPNFEPIAIELLKCRLLCANCHNVRHTGEW